MRRSCSGTGTSSLGWLSTAWGLVVEIGWRELWSDLRILWIKFVVIRWSPPQNCVTPDPPYKNAIQVPKERRNFQSVTV